MNVDLLNTDGIGRNVLEARMREAHVEIVALRRELATVLDNLTATQRRCTALLDEVRASRWLRSVPVAQLRVLGHVAHERSRQDAKWGPIDDAALAIPDGTGGFEARQRRDLAQLRCDVDFRAGNGTWAHVLEEETAEAFAETEVGRLREELVQVAAVAVKWIEILDRRGER